jgi:outer membrane protein
MNSMRYLLLSLLIMTNGALLAQSNWTFTQCIEKAWEQNLDIQRSEMLQEIAEVNLKQSRYSQVPSLNAGATHGYNWGQTIDPFTNEFATDRVRNNNLFLSSEMILFRGFQVRNSIKQSLVDYQASEKDLDRMRNDIGLFVAQSYLNILLNKEQIKAAEAQVSISERQVARMERMVEVGQEAEASLLEIQSQLANDQLSLTQMENALVIAKLGLTNILLLGPEEAAAFDIVDPAVEMDLDRVLPSVQEVYAVAQEKLPQIKAAELRAQSSEVGMAVAQGGRSPQVSVRGSIGSGYSGNNQVGVGEPTDVVFPIGQVANSGEVVIAQSESFSDFEPKSFGDQLEDNFNQSLSFTLTVPIFNGLSVDSDVKRARINYEMAKVDEQSARNQLLQDVQQAHADAVAARRSYEAASRSLEAMELNFSNAEKRFEQDMLSPVDFNDAKSRLAVTQTQAIRAKYDYIFRMTIIDFYLGNPINIQ